MQLQQNHNTISPPKITQSHSLMNEQDVDNTVPIEANNPVPKYIPTPKACQSNYFGRLNVEEPTCQWLERLIIVGAPADIRANVQAILENEQRGKLSVCCGQFSIWMTVLLFRSSHRPSTKRRNSIW